jgi:hypothetical protein
MTSPIRSTHGQHPAEEKPAAATEWLGSLGAQEPDSCATMTPAERIEMVWPITLTAWAFAGKPFDESRFRRDVESFGRRKR